MKYYANQTDLCLQKLKNEVSLSCFSRFMAKTGCPLPNLPRAAIYHHGNKPPIVCFCVIYPDTRKECAPS